MPNNRNLGGNGSKPLHQCPGQLLSALIGGAVAGPALAYYGDSWERLALGSEGMLGIGWVVGWVVGVVAGFSGLLFVQSFRTHAVAAGALAGIVAAFVSAIISTPDARPPGPDILLVIGAPISLSGMVVYDLIVKLIGRFSSNSASSGEDAHSNERDCQ